MHVAVAAEMDPPGPYLPAAHAVPEHVAVAAEVDPAGPYRPAAHAEPEHVEAPAIADGEVTRVRRGTYTTHQTA